MWPLHIKFGLVLVVDLCLCIKLGLQYEILNLDPIKFILIRNILKFGELILKLCSFVVNETYWMDLNYLI